ncbi:uroporphyrinogen-III C-methyltransferase [Colwelliaceae bacterium 6471]
MSENKQAPTTDQSKKQLDSSAIKKSSTVEKSVNQTIPSNNEPALTPTKVSKIAIVALLFALLSSAGVAGIYYWYTSQHAALEKKVNLQYQQKLQASEQRISELLTQQQNQINGQLEQLFAHAQQENSAKIAALENNIARLSQNQPSDWLLHEAEYLVRIASRTIWLEQDTQAAVALLQDADARLQELNDPQYLPIRELIHKDIEALKLMPHLQTEEVILSLMGLTAQVNALPLAMVYIPESNEAEQNFQLSENASDWQENLKKTWHKFLADFITVSRRTANVEPLMSPKHQQYLRQNLQLKLQLAQWAATERKAQIFEQSLSDAQSWLNEYFDMKANINQTFLNGIQTTAKQLVSFDYSVELLSLQALRKLISTQNPPAIPVKQDTGETKTVTPETSNEGML